MGEGNCSKEFVAQIPEGAICDIIGKANLDSDFNFTFDSKQCKLIKTQ